MRDYDTGRGEKERKSKKKAERGKDTCEVREVTDEKCKDQKKDERMKYQRRKMNDARKIMHNSATLTCFAARIEMYCASVPALAELLLTVLVRCELVRV